MEFQARVPAGKVCDTQKNSSIIKFRDLGITWLEMEIFITVVICRYTYIMPPGVHFHRNSAEMMNYAKLDVRQCFKIDCF